MTDFNIFNKALKDALDITHKIRKESIVKIIPNAAFREMGWTTLLD